MSNIDFFLTSGNSVWIRDYGPFCAYDDGELTIIDFFYGTGGQYDLTPVYLAQEYGLPLYQSNLLHHGGNHITDGNGMGFFSVNLTDLNSSWSMEQIRQEMQAFVGLDSLVVFGAMQGDVTGHCDMFVKLLNDTLFVVSEYANPGDGAGNDYYFLNDLATMLDGMQNLDGRDFEVVRLPANPIEGSIVNKSYTNSLIFNDKVLVPTYNTPLDEQALQINAACLPGYEIIGIDSVDLIEYLGAVHCISNTLHAANPMIVFHDPPDMVAAGTAPVLECRLNPRFRDREVELHYILEPGGPSEMVSAVFSGGVWYSQMPTVFDDFDYWFVARVFTDAGVMETVLPENAPAQIFTCAVSGASGVPGMSPLLQPLTAWPNPFNPQVTLSFALSRDAVVTVGVYDVSGRLRNQLLASESLLAGGHEITWDGRGTLGQPLPSGVYFCRVTTEDESSVVRLMLVK